MNLNRFIFTTDDFCPSAIIKYGNYLDRLKSEFPKLTLLAFTTPYFKSLDCESIKHSEMFAEWTSDRKSWLSIGMHGFDHSYPPELTRPFHEKRKLISCAYNMLQRFMPLNWCAKAPGNKIDEEAIRLLAIMGCRWVFLSDNVVYDTIVKKLYMLNRVFSTHINDSTNDSIKKVYPLLRKAFLGINFICPEEIDANFSSW